MIYDDSGDNVPFQMIWNCFCASNCTNCTKLLRFVSISPEIAPSSKFSDQYKHLRYLSFQRSISITHDQLLLCMKPCESSIYNKIILMKYTVAFQYVPLIAFYTENIYTPNFSYSILFQAII